jgi:hypothetical protein
MKEYLWWVYLSISGSLFGSCLFSLKLCVFKLFVHGEVRTLDNHRPIQFDDHFSRRLAQTRIMFAGFTTGTCKTRRVIRTMSFNPYLHGQRAACRPTTNHRHL